MISGQEKNLPKEVKSCDGKKRNSRNVSRKKGGKENENEVDAETERQKERESDYVWEEGNEKE